VRLLICQYVHDVKKFRVDGKEKTRAGGDEELRHELPGLCLPAE
jgi:hypothetical protein